MQENIDYLVQWIDEIRLTIKNLNFKKSSKDILVFMIGNTSQDIGDGRPYITPIRKISSGFVFGSIVYSQTQAILLSKKIDGHVDYIFVDSEKKLPINNNPDHGPFDYFEITNLNLNKNKMVEYGNISSVCSKIIHRSHMFAYKGNDITVVSYSNMVNSVISAAKEDSLTDYSIEIIDLLTLAPMDSESVINSVEKTKRLLVCQEAPASSSVGSTLISEVATSRAFKALNQSPELLAGLHSPMPSAKHLETTVIPQEEDIVQKIKEMIENEQ